MRKILIMLFVALSILSFAQTKEKVAIYTIDNSGEGIAEFVGDFMVNAIVKNEQYLAVERTSQFLAEISKEQAYQRTGEVDDKQISALGKKDGVDYVCIVKVSKAGNNLFSSARLVDVETATIRTISRPIRYDYNDLENIEKACVDMIKSMFEDKRAFTQNEHKKNVAIYIIDNFGKTASEYIGDLLADEIVKSGKYVAVERTNQFLAELKKEQNYQRTGAVDESQISKLGEQMGVNYVCIVKTSNFKGASYLSARLLDVVSSVVETSSKPAIFNYNDFNDVEKSCKELVRSIFGVTKENGHEYVDLGLPSGIMWAACNVGASTPEEYGYYFAWGETSPKKEYSWSTYKYGNAENKLTKYCDVSSFGKKGFTDDKSRLEACDDAAHIRMGGTWRVPTWKEQYELFKYCTWILETKNGVNGYIVKSTINGNFIFLPLAGYYTEESLYSDGINGRYWHSEVEYNDPSHVMLSLDVTKYNSSGFNNIISREMGLPVRPVCSPKK